jgi:hypothetical protein
LLADADRPAIDAFRLTTRASKKLEKPEQKTSTDSFVGLERRF